MSNNVTSKCDKLNYETCHPGLRFFDYVQTVTTGWIQVGWHGAQDMFIEGCEVNRAGRKERESQSSHSKRQDTSSLSIRYDGIRYGMASPRLRMSRILTIAFHLVACGLQFTASQRNKTHQAIAMWCDALRCDPIEEEIPSVGPGSVSAEPLRSWWWKLFRICCLKYASKDTCNWENYVQILFVIPITFYLYVSYNGITEE